MRCPVSIALRQALAVCALLAFAGPAPAQELAEEGTWLAPARVSPSLAPVAEGYVEWLRERVAAAGVSVRPGPDVRRALAGAGGAPALLRAAREAGAPSLLLVDLLADGDDAVVLLTLHDGEGRIVAARRGRAPRARLAETSRRVLEGVLPALGGPESLERPAPLRLETLAACSRALAALDRGDLATAWRELKGRTGSGAEAIHARIEAAAASPATPPAQKARLLTAQGEPERAWRLVGADVTAAVRRGDAVDPALWVAAGEAQLGRGKTRTARALFERVLAVDPGNPEARLGHALVLARQNEREAAKRELREAAKLAPDSTRALDRLAELEAGDPAQRASVLFEAGSRAAQQMHVRDARSRMEAAARLDPALRASAAEVVARAEARAGDHAAAIRDYQQAVQAGAATGAVLGGMARSHRASGDSERALVVYRAAVEAHPDDAELLRDLGQLYQETGRPAEAAARLERALALAPRDGRAARLLARSLDTAGESERALDAWAQAAALDDPGAEPDELRGAAARLLEAGRSEPAGRMLEHAVALDPAVAEARLELARVYEQSGRSDAASRERALAQQLEPALVEHLAAETRAAERAADPADPAEELREGEATGESFDAVLATFVTGLPPDVDVRRVALLGLRELPDWKTRALQWLHPRAVDRAGLERELRAALSLAWSVQPPPDLEGLLRGRVDELYAFGSPASLDAGTIATVNASLGVDAVFVGRLLRGGGNRCSIRDGLEVELRMLTGSAEHAASILANSACLPGTLAAHSTWNPRAAGVAGALLLLVLLSVRRGFGTVVVKFRLPPKSRALFSVRLGRRPRPFRAGSAKDAEGKRWRFEQRLRSMSPFERRLEGEKVVFKWVRARRGKYYVTMRGPLMDYLTDQLIGDFLEEKSLVVKRGPNEVEFDLRGQECAVEVRVVRGDQPQSARVALRGVADSLRYAREGRAFLYVRPGEHVVVVATEEGVVERNVLVDPDTTATCLTVDLRDEHGIVFRGCPDAVERYVEGDLAGAADALAAAGQEDVAHLVRAQGHSARGETQLAATALQAAGRLEEAAALRAAEHDLVGSAELYAQAGEHRRAAEAYRESGDVVAAARAFEEAHDWAGAADCYRELGDSEKLLDMLERSGELFEAGEIARELGQADRAIRDLQQVDSRHYAHGEACRMLAELLEARGETDLALERYAEAIERGGDGVALELRDRYAKLLESAGRTEEALAAYEEIRRRDLHWGDAATRIESLRKEATQRSEAATVVRTGGEAAVGIGAPAVAAPVKSRYEIQGELGRGGMGVVFRARDTHLGRVVALKVLPENLREHPAAVTLFLREARAAAALNHPNIVTVYDAGQEGDTYFISMECLEGLPLNAILEKRGRLTAKDVARLGVQIAAGLEYAHRSRIVHRDIKTSNLFFTRDRVVKIMDFGLAKMMEEVRRSSTMIGGTPYYMAPEQAAGEAVDHRTDLYALGVTFFHLLTGTYPFTEGDMAYHHRHTPPPDVHESVADVPEALADLVRRLMGKRPDERPESAAEVARICQSLLR